MIGTVLSHYRIVEKVGEGGMGEVYRAEDQRLQRSVAIKILPEHAVASAERRERFIREARAASSLNHPGIVHVYDVDESGGRLFIAMEYVAGRTVSQLLEAKRLDIEETLRIGIEAGEALGAAHAHGIVHRDVKPSNIIVADEGFVKILDFGLAKLLGPGAESSSPDEASTRAPNLTRHGQLIGTVLYMSPELALGETVDHRSDIFSFGAVLYEMATGRLPFTGASEVAIIDRILHGAPSPLSEIEPELPEVFDRIVSKALEKRPESRYQSMEELLVDLKNLKRDLEAAASPAVVRTGMAIFGRVHPHRSSAAKAALWGGLAVAIAVAAAVAIDRGNGDLAHAAERQEHSIAVLAFENAEGDPESRYFSDGVTEGIIVDLSRIDGLKVLPPTKGPVPAASEDPIAAARRLKVETVLVGSVRRGEGNVRVSASLRAARDGRVVWADKFDRPLTGVFGIQDEVSSRIAEALEIRLTSGEKALIAKAPTSSIKAYDLYLRGQDLANRREPRALRQAIGQFEEARRIDPKYALAVAGLADAYSVAVMYDWDLGLDARKGAEEASRQAIALDPTLAEAHLSRGVVAGLAGDLDGGISRVLHAISLDPESAHAHHWLSLLHKFQGEYDKARADDFEALRLDPKLAVVHLNLAHLAILSNHPNEAVERMQALLKLGSDLPLVRVLEAWGLMRTGEAGMALRILDGVAAAAPDDALVAGMHGMALAAAGNVAAARGEASRAADLSSRKPSPLAEYAVACIHAQTGDREQAFRFLRQALKAKAVSLGSIISPAYIRSDPVLGSLRSDPRFADLVGPP